MQWLSTKEYRAPCGVRCLTIDKIGHYEVLVYYDDILYWCVNDAREERCEYDEITHFCVIQPPSHNGKINFGGLNNTIYL